MAAYKIIVAHKLKFKTPVYIHELHLCAKLQLYSLNRSLTKNNHKSLKFVEIFGKSFHIFFQFTSLSVLIKQNLQNQ